MKNTMKQIPHADLYVMHDLEGKAKQIIMARKIGGKWFFESLLSLNTELELSSFLQNSNYPLVKTIPDEFNTLCDILVFVDYKRADGWEKIADNIIKGILDKRRIVVLRGRRWGLSRFYNQDEEDDTE